MFIDWQWLSDLDQNREDYGICVFTRRDRFGDRRMFLSTRHSNENFRLGPLTRASYASLALGTTILALGQPPK